MTNKIIIALGLSLIIGVSSGYMYSEERYFMLGEGTGNEISKTQFLKWSESDNAQFVRKEDIFNITKALTFGIASFGALLVIGALINKKK